jgi:hypothetical protein
MILIHFFQIVKIANGNIFITDDLKAAAQRHVLSKGFTYDNYQLPTLYVNLITQIINKCQQRHHVQAINMQVTQDMLRRYENLITQKFHTMVLPEYRQLYQNTVVIEMQTGIAALCYICRKSLKVWDKETRDFQANNFFRHIYIKHNIIDDHLFNFNFRPNENRQNENRHNENRHNVNRHNNANDNNEQVNEIQQENEQINQRRPLIEPPVNLPANANSNSVSGMQNRVRRTGAGRRGSRNPRN